MESLKNLKLAKWYWGVFYLYIVALTCSTAGMELGGALLSLTFIAVIGLKIFRKESLKPLRFQGDYLLWGFVFFILFGALFIEGLNSHERIEILRSSRFILTLYALVIGLWVLKLNTPQRLETLMKLLFSCMLVVSTYGIVQFFTGLDLLRKTPYEMTIFSDGSVLLWRVKAFFTNTMTYSYIFGMFFCLLAAFWYFKSVKFKKPFVFHAAVFLVLLSLFMTFTRGLWISLIAALLLMAALISWRLSSKILAGVILIFGLGIGMSHSFRERIIGVVQLDQSNSERLLIWKNHWEMFKDHPLLGVGFEQNARLMQEYNLKLYGKEWRVVHAHNHFLQILTGVGIFGFIFFVLFSISMYWLAFKLWFLSEANDIWSKAIALGSIGAQTVFHLGGMSEAVFVDRESNHAYLLVLALTIVCYQAVRRAPHIKSY